MFIAPVNVVTVVVKFSLSIIESISKVFSNVDTAATMLYRAGVDIRTLQELLGHTSIATTQLYTHIDNNDIKKAVKLNPLNNVN